MTPHRASHTFPVLLLIVLAFLLGMTGCSPDHRPAPTAKAGSLDLGNWDFRHDGPVSLDGEYEFFWLSLLGPGDLPAGPADGAQLASLPGYWNAAGPLPGNGYATYRLRVRLPLGQVYGLKLTEVLTAFRVWVDGQERYANGQVGSDELQSRPEYRPGVVYFQSRNEWTELLIQVSNFHYRKGGIWTTFVLGTPESISNDWYLGSHLNLLLIGCLAIMGLYHLGLFFLRRTDRSSLWFALFCFVVLMRIVSTGDQLLSQWLPGFSWELARKLEYLPLNIGSLFFMFFITTLFPREVRRWLLYAFAAVAILFGLAVVVLPAAVSNNLVMPMQIYVVLASIWIVVTILRAVAKRREGAVMVLVGTIVLVATVANDMAYSNQMLDTGYVMPLGFFVLVFFQAFMLAVRFTRSYKKAEFLGAALADTNQALRRFVPYEFLDFLHKKSIVDVKLGDQIQKEMSILFSDIRSFTSLSERLSPKENFNFLNSYLERIGPVIRANGGFIDKYLGDGIMALFPDRIEAALQAAKEMQQKVREYNVHRAKSGYDPISIGIAINVGHLMLGTIGESDRMDTTVISDAVNLASRMEGLSKIYGPGVIVTMAVIERLAQPADWHWRRLGRIRVRGREEAIELVQVLDGLEDEMIDQLLDCRSDWEAALAAYARGAMAEAARLFDGLAERLPGDPARAVFHARARDWLERGVPAGWDGVENWADILRGNPAPQ